MIKRMLGCFACSVACEVQKTAASPKERNDIAFVTLFFIIFTIIIKPQGFAVC
jgi:hypothetical protein